MWANLATAWGKKKLLPVKIIQNSLIILHILGPHLICFVDFEFFDLPCIFKIFKTKGQIGDKKFEEMKCDILLSATA